MNRNNECTTIELTPNNNYETMIECHSLCNNNYFQLFDIMSSHRYID